MSNPEPILQDYHRICFFNCSYRQCLCLLFCCALERLDPQTFLVLDSVPNVWLQQSHSPFALKSLSVQNRPDKVSSPISPSKQLRQQQLSPADHWHSSQHCMNLLVAGNVSSWTAGYIKGFGVPPLPMVEMIVLAEPTNWRYTLFGYHCKLGYQPPTYPTSNPTKQ